MTERSVGAIGDDDGAVGDPVGATASPRPLPFTYQAAMRRALDLHNSVTLGWPEPPAAGDAGDPAGG